MSAPPVTPVNIIYGDNPKRTPTINTRGVLINADGTGVDYDVYGAEVSGDGGGGISAGVWVTDYRYDILEIPDGINQVFSLRYNYVSGTCHAHINGLRQTPNNPYNGDQYDFEEIGNKQVKFNVPPRADIDEDNKTLLVIDYVTTDVEALSGVYTEQYNEVYQ